MRNNKTCWLCGTDAESEYILNNRSNGWTTQDDTRDTYWCDVCGVYETLGEDLEKYRWQPPETFEHRFSDMEFEEKKALLRYNVWLNAPRKGTDPYDPLRVTGRYIKEIFKQPFPTPPEQCDYLVRFLGQKTRRLGVNFDTKIELNGKKLLSATASVDKENLDGIIAFAKERGLIHESEGQLSLTPNGWERFSELQKPNKDSNGVFLAMQFDKEQEGFLINTLGPCVAAHGLMLKPLTEYRVAENILDLKLRNAIRDSRILICDLTHRNNGAYFEAGFAEGLRLPVIYVCEQSSFDKRSESFADNIYKRFWRIHFDVEHQEIYLWKNDDDASIAKFQSDMSAKIQAVLR